MRVCVRVCVCLQIAGNPDQQEDDIDEQYQEDAEEEVCDNTILLVKVMRNWHRSLFFCCRNSVFI